VQATTRLHRYIFFAPHLAVSSFVTACIRLERMDTTNLLDLSIEELHETLAELGEPRFRTGQVFQWLWEKRCRNIEDMTNLSKALREKLAESAVISYPEIAETAVSSDGTVKFLLRLKDGELVETVLIPDEAYTTQCLSTQVGCTMACTFCSTGQMGFTRSMTQAEILGQILVAQDYIQQDGSLPPLRNTVFMGMGEPLLNTDAVIRSLRIMTDPKAFGFSTRKITVSSVGIPAGIQALGEAALCRLAISLHAPTQELREQIMPKAARMTPLDQLMDILDQYPLRPRERVTYEYILLRGVNDRPEHARQLAKLLGNRKAKVNLIACNPAPGDPYEAPLPEDVLTFEKILWSRDITVILRKSRGQDIAAACGQLKVQLEAQQ